MFSAKYCGQVKLRDLVNIYTFVIESRWEKDSTTNFRFARLNLLDLAGSERYGINPNLV